MEGKGKRRLVNEANWLGIFFIVIGGAALAKAMLLPLPEWVFSWQMLIVVFGFFIGFRSAFRNPGWIVMILIGGIFLVKEFFPDLIDPKVLWPSALILVGIFFLVKPRGRHAPHEWKKRFEDKFHKIGTDLPDVDPSWELNEDNYIDSTSVFGGIRKIIVSKDFKGGDVTNILGGCELNFKQADIHGTIKLDVTQVLGGTVIIVPPNWKIIPRMTAFMGGVEDKRTQLDVIPDPNKTLILDGTSILGGIEIKNY